MKRIRAFRDRAYELLEAIGMILAGIAAAMLVGLAVLVATAPWWGMAVLAIAAVHWLVTSGAP